MKTITKKHKKEEVEDDERGLTISRIHEAVSINVPLCEKKEGFKIGIIGGRGNGKSGFFNLLLQDGEKTKKYLHDWPLPSLARGHRVTDRITEVTWAEEYCVEAYTLEGSLIRKFSFDEDTDKVKLFDDIIDIQCENGCHMIKVKGPFKALKDSGVTLVDLPGFEEKLESYIRTAIEQCDVVIVMTQRSVRGDDSTANTFKKHVNFGFLNGTLKHKIFVFLHMSDAPDVTPTLTSIISEQLESMWQIGFAESSISEDVELYTFALWYILHTSICMMQTVNSSEFFDLARRMHSAAGVYIRMFRETGKMESIDFDESSPFIFPSVEALKTFSVTENVSVDTISDLPEAKIQGTDEPFIRVNETNNGKYKVTLPLNVASRGDCVPVFVRLKSTKPENFDAFIEAVKIKFDPSPVYVFIPSNLESVMFKSKSMCRIEAVVYSGEFNKGMFDALAIKAQINAYIELDEGAVFAKWSFYDVRNGQKKECSYSDVSKLIFGLAGALISNSFQKLRTTLEGRERSIMMANSGLYKHHQQKNENYADLVCAFYKVKNAQKDTANLCKLLTRMKLHTRVTEFKGKLEEDMKYIRDCFVISEARFVRPADLGPRKIGDGDMIAFFDDKVAVDAPGLSLVLPFSRFANSISGFSKAQALSVTSVAFDYTSKGSGGSSINRN